MLFRFIGAFFAYFSAFVFVSTSLQAADQAYTGDRLNMNTIIERYDEFKGNDMWRADVPGAYRTKWGTQIDKTCLDQLEFLNKKKVDLEEWVNETVHSVIEYCGDYTQLHKYIKPWVTYLRRAVIICEPEKSIRYGAYAPTLKFRKTWGKNVSIHSKDYFKKTRTLQRLAKSYEPTYVFTPSGFLEIGLLAHEVFHTTNANSHLRHDVALIKDLEKREKIQMEDRVYNLEKICSPSNVPVLNDFLDDPKLCIRTFTKKMLFGIGSSPLTLNEAQSLCNQFKVQDRCLEEITKTKENKILEAAYIKEIHTIQDEFLKEALPYLPQWEGHFPKKSWKLLPQHVQDSILDAVKKVKDDACFQENVYIDEVTGDLTFAWSGPGEFNFKQYSRKNLGADLFSDSSHTEAFLRSIPKRCANPEVQAALESLVEGHQWLKRLASDEDYTDIIIYSSLLRMARESFSKKVDLRIIMLGGTWDIDMEIFRRIFSDFFINRSSDFFSKNYYKELKAAVRKLYNLYDARTCIKATTAAHQLLQLSVPSGENFPCSSAQQE